MAIGYSRGYKGNAIQRLFTKIRYCFYFRMLHKLCIIPIYDGRFRSSTNRQCATDLYYFTLDLINRLGLIVIEERSLGEGQFVVIAFVKKGSWIDNNELDRLFNQDSIKKDFEEYCRDREEYYKDMNEILKSKKED